ncbi:helix-turn-helix domain-containing protein [Desulfococcaceae bacterium HSG8]|nr:helix-turn-helix domain-containing protein [Desulfococcaceae bacterium HSG8]
MDQRGIISRMMQAYSCAKDAELAAHLDVKKGTISNYRRGRRKIPLAAVIKAAKDTDSTLDWLITGKPSGPNTVLNIQNVAKPKTFHPEFAYDNYIPVRLLKDEIAAGMPSDIRDEDTEGYCLIFADKEWIPGDPEQYVCCRVKGDSMYPILKEGDIVAIDHSQRDPGLLNKQMVAFRYEGGASVKWLSYVKEDRVLGIPENKNNIDSTICLVGEETETGIIGKVAWWWAKGK